MATRQDLTDRIAELEELLGLTAQIPVVVRLRERGLPRTAARLLGMLIQRPFVPYDSINDALFGDRPIEKRPDIWAVRTAIKQVRAATKSLGVEIKTSYGEGLSLDPAEKVKLLRAWPEIDNKTNIVHLPRQHQRFPREVPFQ